MVIPVTDVLGAGWAAPGAQMGVPQPEDTAIIAMVAELGGSVLLILGLTTPLAALLPAVVLIGAVGPGRLSVDGLLTRLRRHR